MMAALFIYFRTIIGPLLLAFILAYLFQPIAARLNSSLHLPWRTSVNVIYLFSLIVLVSLVTITGLALIQQAQSLVTFIDNFIQDLPQLVNQLSTQTYTIGPFPLDFSQFDLQAAAQQLLGMVQPLVGQAGNLVARFAASAATTVGWALFILLVSYFLLSESGQVRENLVRIDIPGYNADSQRLITELTAYLGCISPRSAADLVPDRRFILYPTHHPGNAPVDGDRAHGRDRGIHPLYRSADHLDRHRNHCIFTSRELLGPGPGHLCCY